MKKMLYIMHIDWDWIKQRPQFIAEELSNMYDLKILYAYSKNKKDLKKNSRNNLSLIPFFRIPKRRQIKLLYALNNFLLKLFFSIIIKINKPDYIFLTHPELYNYIPKNNKFKIIYDCMDDVTEFETEHTFKELIKTSEFNLVNESYINLVSSENLIKKIKSKYKLNSNMFLVRNAFNGKIIDNNKEKNINKKDNYKVCYIGTISSWFDIEALEYSIKENSSIEYHIIGPIDIDISKIKNDKIKFYSTIKHDELYKYVKEFDCLIMPFKLNEIVESVDPVKLYEYINFNKPIVSIYYDEISRFEDFVYFYNNKQELVRILTDLSSGNKALKYDEIQRDSFLKENTWKYRANYINNLICENE